MGRFFLLCYIALASNVNLSTMFINKINPITKEQEWTFKEANYNYQYEIGRSGYGDMLQDTQRNEGYLKAFRSYILKESPPECILDIGTGTGLLAMMASKVFANASIIACDSFSPMVKISKEVIQKNKLSGNIKVIHKNSSELQIPNDLAKKASLVVHEIVDSELLGEGILRSLRDANERLLTEDASRIPYKAVLYGQIIYSEVLWNCHKTPTFPALPSFYQNCYGRQQSLEIQANQIKDLKPVSEIFTIFEFDFSHIPEYSKPNHRCVNVRLLEKANGHGVLFWWDLYLYEDIKLSTNPFDENYYWRNHWMQALSFFPQVLACNKNKTIKLDCFHDDYSVWFRALELENPHLLDSFKNFYKRPSCSCNFHNYLPSSRISELNNVYLVSSLADALKKNYNKSHASLNLSDGSLAAFILLATIEETSAIFTLEEDNRSRALLERSDFPPLQNNGIGMLIGEPYFNTSSFPWQNLYFYYALHQLSFKGLLEKAPVVVPNKAKLMACAVELRDLWKTHTPVKEVCGFDLSPFRNLLCTETNSLEYELSERDAYLQCLAQYQFKILSAPLELLIFDSLTEWSEDLQSKKSLKLNTCVSFGKDFVGHHTCHGLIVYADYYLTPEHIVSGFPSLDFPLRKQALFFFERPLKFQPSFPPTLSVESFFSKDRLDLTLLVKVLKDN